MKEISITLWEITFEEVMKLSEDNDVLTYNTVTGAYRTFRPSFWPLYTSSSSYRVFFTFEKPKFKESKNKNTNL